MFTVKKVYLTPLNYLFNHSMIEGVDTLIVSGPLNDDDDRYN